jgi:filamentous hemagglutinin family protein
MMKAIHSLTSVLRHTLVSALSAALAVGPGAALRAYAGPQRIQGARGGSAGATVVDNHDGTWTIHAPNGSILNYTSFNIEKGETVTFIQGAPNARALNRVFSAKPTEIKGTLTADGIIYLVNPAGVFFRNGSVVNANEIHAAAGRMSDRDFQRGEQTGVDHYSGLRGEASNEGEIAAKAVSLVGMRVTNSNSIVADGGWIILAAGRDVLIGRDGQQNGVLLRIEGAANAIFNPSATGVSNKGSLTATADPTIANKGGGVTLGAGDLYGTAIFSNGAINARKLALQADNRGDVALGGSIETPQLEAKFAGNNTGELRGAEPGTTATIHTDTVNLIATGDRGTVKVGDGLSFRGVGETDKGPKAIIVDQNANLATSDVKGLEHGAANDTTVTLTSHKGAIAVDDRALVAGTKLSLDSQIIDIRGKEALDVDSLQIKAFSTFSNADIVARGEDGISAKSNIALVTRVPTSADPGAAGLISAHAGKLTVDGDITTNNGGALKLEAKEVELGSFDPVRGSSGGIVDVSGSVKPHLEIGFTDSNGVQQTKTVTLNAINTEARKPQEKSPRSEGGDVVINATGEVIVRDSISTLGDKGNGTDALAGGSVHITAGPTSAIRIGSIRTGGADAPADGAAEAASVSLHAGRIVASGNIDTHGDAADGSRDRSIDLDGAVELNANQIAITGGDVTLGKVKEGVDPSTNFKREVGLTVTSSGKTTFGGPVSVESLTVASEKDGTVTFGGDVRAATRFDVSFTGGGHGVIAARDSNDDPLAINVLSEAVTLSAFDKGDTKATTASVSVDPTIHFTLADHDKNSDPKVDDIARGIFTLDQDANIDEATTAALFTPDRFSVIGPKPFDPANPDEPGGTVTHSGLSGETVRLKSNAAASLDANARAAVQGSDLKVDVASFQATGTDSPFDLASLDLKTDGALDASFDVTATNSVTLTSGNDGKGGGLAVSSHLNADEIHLVAGHGGSGHATGAAVTFGAGAQLRSANGGNAKVVEIKQDQDLNTSALPSPSLFGSTGNPLAGLDYRLGSNDGAVTIDSDSQVAGSNLSLAGKTVSLGPDGAPALQVAGLTVTTPGQLVVARDIQTGANGKISLQAGTDGKHNLVVSKTLAADDIALKAGSGVQAISRVDLTGATLRGSTAGTAPKSFLLAQDATIGESNTPIPVFAGPIAGMTLQLTSVRGAVTIADASAVQDNSREQHRHERERERPPGPVTRGHGQVDLPRRRALGRRRDSPRRSHPHQRHGHRHSVESHDPGRRRSHRRGRDREEIRRRHHAPLRPRHEPGQRDQPAHRRVTHRRGHGLGEGDGRARHVGEQPRSEEARPHGRRSHSDFERPRRARGRRHQRPRGRRPGRLDGPDQRHERGRHPRDRLADPGRCADRRRRRRRHARGRPHRLLVEWRQGRGDQGHRQRSGRQHHAEREPDRRRRRGLLD